MEHDFDSFDTGFFDYAERNEYVEEEHPTDALIRELEEDDYDV